MTEPKPAPNLSDAWWTTEHVRHYLHFRNSEATRRWMRRHGVRFCRNNRFLTCRAWVDKALDGKGQPALFPTAQPQT